MFDFLRRWAFNRSRFIFNYWNGSRTVKADPMVLWRALQQHEDYSESDFMLLKIEALRNQITPKMAAIVRQVFSIAPPDTGGLTELECLTLLRLFIEYAGFQKKSGEQTQTLPQPTTVESSDGLTGGGNTNDSSDSTSTSVVSEP